MPKTYMRPHHNCPYYDKGEAKCVRTGCLFLTPCVVVNDTCSKIRGNIFIKPKGKQHDTRRK